MSDDWRKQLEDPEERRVFEALARPEWDFRTVQGLAKETGLETLKVKEVLDTRSDLVRRSAVPGPGGADLFTLKEQSPRETLSILRGAISKSTS